MDYNYPTIFMTTLPLINYISVSHLHKYLHYIYTYIIIKIQISIKILLQWGSNELIIHKFMTLQLFCKINHS